MTTDEPKFIHDTRHIISVNESGCELFHCPEEALIDLALTELIAHEDHRGLARLRLTQMRIHDEIPPFIYVFQRCDGSQFYAAVVSDRIGAGQFETRVIHIREK